MAEANDGYPGAEQVDSWRNITDPKKPMIPLATELGGEWQRVGEPCSGELEFANDLLEGGFCQQSADVLDGDELIVVIGDSHAQQLSAPLSVGAEQYGVDVVALFKGGCTIGADEEDRGINDVACSDWMPAAIDLAIGLEPDAVYVVATRASATTDETVLAGAQETIDRFRDANVPVMAVRDNPRFAFNMYDCVIDAGMEACAVPKSEALGTQNRLDDLRGVIPIDYTP